MKVSLLTQETRHTHTHTLENVLVLKAISFLTLTNSVPTHSSEVFVAPRQLEMTAQGMPMSCVSLGILVIKLFHTMDDEHLHEWFVSAIEMRSLCLHNQSWREMRMAKVAEVRDCANFSWSSLLRSPLLLRKLAGVIKTATLYPEVRRDVVVDCVVAFCVLSVCGVGADWMGGGSGLWCQR